MDLAAVGQSRPEHAVVTAGGETDQLPCGGEVGGKIGDRDVLHEDAEGSLVELLGEAQLLQAPGRVQPGATDQEQYRLATVGRFVQPALPTLASGNPARRIQIEEEVVPAFRRQPVGERHRLGIVGARMAEEDARQ